MNRGGVEQRLVDHLPVGGTLSIIIGVIRMLLLSVDVVEGGRSLPHPFFGRVGTLGQVIYF